MFQEQTRSRECIQSRRGGRAPRTQFCSREGFPENVALESSLRNIKEQKAPRQEAQLEQRHRDGNNYYFRGSEIRSGSWSALWREVIGDEPIERTFKEVVEHFGCHTIVVFFDWTLCSKLAAGFEEAKEQEYTVNTRPTKSRPPLIPPGPSSPPIADTSSSGMLLREAGSQLWKTSRYHHGDEIGHQPQKRNSDLSHAPGTWS